MVSLGGVSYELYQNKLPSARAVVASSIATGVVAASHLAAGVKMAKGEYTPSSPVVTDATHSSIIYVSTGLASPVYGMAFMAQSQTGMNSKRQLRLIGATGSYLKFLGVIATTSGRYGLVSSTTTFEFTWLAWEA